MYTSYIGKKFLTLYKEKYQKSEDYSARQFFDEVMFPLFFDDEKHLMHVHGSTFFQKVGKDDLKNGISESLVRLSRLHRDIENKKYSGSTYVGYAAEKIQEVTSGQVTSLDCKIDSEEIYASWIGEGFAIGLSGGMMLLSEENILWGLFEGWNFYRKYLKQTPNMKGRQIETWNGYWLCHFLNKKFNKERPLDNFELPLKKDEEENSVISIPTQKWSMVVFMLSKEFPDSILTAYSYFLGKTNTTLGFINLYLPEVSEIYHLRDKLFIDYKYTILRDEQIERLETFYTFRNACKLGSIGLKSIEPIKLREYMPIGSIDYARGQEYKFTDEKSYFNYSLYKLWIVAMLNKTELLDLATKLAKSLLDIEAKRKDEKNRGKTDRDIDDVKGAKNLRTFIELLTPLIEESNADLFATTVEQVLKMPVDNFPLFITLVRFEYAYLNLKK